MVADKTKTKFFLTAYTSHSVFRSAFVLVCAADSLLSLWGEVRRSRLSSKRGSPPILEKR